jgi:N-methylhydantoinase B
MGDIRAMIAALAAGRRRLEQTIARHGIETVLDAEQDLVAYAAAKAHSALRQVPDGTYRFVDLLDDDAASNQPVRLALAMTVRDGTVHLDFTGTDPQVATAMNIPSCGRPHAWLTLRVLALVHTLDPTVPLNVGLLEPVSVTLPKGSLVNPVPPAATGVRHAAAIRVNDLLNGALGMALPEVMPAASSGTVIPLVMAEPNEAGGRDVQVIEPMIGGTGARHGHDGVDGRDSGISNLANNPVETVEAEVAVEILRYAIRPDSGGAGEWRGGCGMELTLRALKDGSNILGRGIERQRFRPWGMRGGHPGAPARLFVNRGTDRERELGKIDVLEVDAGDVVTVLTPGAGGYGDPIRRDQEAVLADVRNGFVSAGAARENYGVVIVDGAIDREATARARAGMTRSEAPVSFGPERDSWDEVFTPALLDALNAALFALPPARRTRERNLVYRLVMDCLPEGFPRVPADERQATAARAKLTELVETMQRHARTLV